MQKICSVCKAVISGDSSICTKCGSSVLQEIVDSESAPIVERIYD